MTARPRIALLIHALHGGGAEKLMSQLASRWAEHYDIHLITWSSVTTDAYALDERVHRIGLNLMHPSRSALDGIRGNLQRVHALRRKLRNLQPDLILSFSDQMNILSLEASRERSVPHIISEHSNPERQRLSRLWELWRRRSYPRATAAHALTESIAQYMSRWVATDRLHVIPPAIERPSPRDLLQQEKKQGSVARSLVTDVASPSRCNVLFVGRLSPEKGVDRLLSAWQRVAAEVPQAQLTIVGDGPLRSELEQTAVTLQGVRFYGWVDDPWSVVAEVDLFVLPSRYEGFPVALLEAMARGYACVTTNCSTALQELNGRAASHLAVEVLDGDAGDDQLVVAKMTDALVALYRDPQQRLRLSRAGQAAAQNYTWDVIGPQWDDLLQLMLSKQ